MKLGLLFIKAVKAIKDRPTYADLAAWDIMRVLQQAGYGVSWVTDARRWASESRNLEVTREGEDSLITVTWRTVGFTQTQRV